MTRHAILTLALCLFSLVSVFAQGADGQIEVFRHPLTAPDKPVRQMMSAAALQALPATAMKDLLVVWGRPTPNTLWYLAAPPFGTGKLQQLALRTVTLNWPNAPAGRMMEMPVLAPLLPCAPEPASSFSPVTPGAMVRPEYGGQPTKTPEFNDLSLGGRLNTPTALWPARYIVLEDTGLYYQQITGFLDVPPAGEATIPFPELAKRQQPPRPERTPDRPVSLKYPEADYAALKPQGAGFVQFSYDVPVKGLSSFTPDIFTARGGSPMMPVAATKLTIGWLGVGTIRDVPLPAAPADGNWRGTPTPTVILPAWEPGPVVSGTVLNADGTPYANGTLRVTAAITPCRTPHRMLQLAITTDANGAFSVKGVTPGLLSITTGERADQQASWVRDVPAAGLQDLTLRMAAKPMRIELRGMTQYAAPAAWWLPDNGAPRALAAFSSHDVPDGPGYVWAHDGGMGVAKYLRFTPETGLRAEPAGQRPLVLYVPAAGPMLLGETTVTLTGVGKCAGITATFTYITWRAASLLNVLYARVADVPPGDYRVRLTTQLGTAEQPVTIGAEGGWVLLKPAK